MGVKHCGIMDNIGYKVRKSAGCGRADWFSLRLHMIIRPYPHKKVAHLRVGWRFPPDPRGTEVKKLVQHFYYTHFCEGQEVVGFQNSKQYKGMLPLHSSPGRASRRTA